MRKESITIPKENLEAAIRLPNFLLLNLYRMKKSIGTLSLLLLIFSTLLVTACRRKGCGECRDYCTYSSPDTSYYYSMELGGGALYACDDDLERMGYEPRSSTNSSGGTTTCTPSCR